MRTEPNQKHPSSSYARILFRHLRLKGESSQKYFAGTKVTYTELMTLDGSIARDDLAQIYRNALAISKCEDLGLSVGTQLHLSAHGPLGVATFTGPDLRTGMGLLAKYSHTRTDSFNVSISEHPQGMKVRFAENLDLGDLREFMTEAVLIGLFSAINFFIGAGQFKGQVSFSYHKPSYGDKYHDYFGDNIKFDQPATEIIIPESNLSVPSPTADSDMHQRSVEILERNLKAIRAGETIEAAGPENSDLSTKEVVVKLVTENPGRIWTLKDVSAKLHMSPRTVIRKLASEGTKFQVVRDEVAKQQAATYLSDASLSVESVGYLMGFSDVSSFRRSFKRWFGETPSQYIARVR